LSIARDHLLKILPKGKMQIKLIESTMQRYLGEINLIRKNCSLFALTMFMVQFYIGAIDCKSIKLAIYQDSLPLIKA